MSTPCFNERAACGWEHEEWNQATYYTLRVEHSTLPAQLVVVARTSVSTPYEPVVAIHEQLHA